MQQASDRSNHGIDSRQCADSAQQASQLHPYSCADTAQQASQPHSYSCADAAQQASQPHSYSCADAAQQASQPHLYSCAEAAQQASQLHPYSLMSRHRQSSVATEPRAQPVAAAAECWQAFQGRLPSQCNAVHSSQSLAEQTTTVNTSLLPSQCVALHLFQSHAEQSTTVNSSLLTNQCTVVHSSKGHAEQLTTVNTSSQCGVRPDLCSQGQQDCSVSSQNGSTWLQTGQIPTRSGTALPTIVEVRAVRRSLWAESGNMTS